MVFDQIIPNMMSLLRFRKFVLYKGHGRLIKRTGLFRSTFSLTAQSDNASHVIHKWLQTGPLDLHPTHETCPWADSSPVRPPARLEPLAIGRRAEMRNASPASLGSPHRVTFFVVYADKCHWILMSPTQRNSLITFRLTGLDSSCFWHPKLDLSPPHHQAMGRHPCHIVATTPQTFRSPRPRRTSASPSPKMVTGVKFKPVLIFEGLYHPFTHTQPPVLGSLR